MTSIIDTDFGEILLRENSRARGFTFRVREGQMVVTLPPRCTERELRESIERMRPKLQKLWEKAAKSPVQQPALRHIDWNFRLESESLTLCFAPEERLRDNEIRLHKEQGHIIVYCPADFDFDREGVQDWLEKVIEEQVRSYAKGMLPARLRALSQQFDLPFADVRINAAHGRWGSCGRKQQRGLFGWSSQSDYHIHLSLYTLLLPERLQRLVMLHELTHTLEMNHSPRFHARLNAMLDGQEAALEKELKRYTTSIFAFAQHDNT